MEIELLAIVEKTKDMDLNTEHCRIHLLLLVRLELVRKKAGIIFDEAVKPENEIIEEFYIALEPHRLNEGESYSEHEKGSLTTSAD